MMIAILHMEAMGKRIVAIIFLTYLHLPSYIYIIIAASDGALQPAFECRYSSICVNRKGKFTICGRFGKRIIGEGSS